MTEPITEEWLAVLMEFECKGEHWEKSVCHICERRQMAEEIQQVRQADRWIPVEEKLPDENEEPPEFVLVSWSPEWWGRKLSPHDDEDGSRADCSGVGTCFVPYLLAECIGKFTHWRPLPAPERTEKCQKQ